MNIRTYKESDWETILNWWIEANENPPYKEFMNNETSFILEIDNKLLASVTVYLTNSKEVAFLENFIRNPEYKDKKGIQYLVNYAEDFTKKHEYKRLIALSYKDRLKDRMENLGYKKTLNNLSSLVKEL